MKRDVLPLKLPQFISDCSRLTAKERGAFILLLAYSWANGGRIPSDPDSLSVIAGLTISDLENHGHKLAPLFDKEDGFWVYRQHEALFRRSAKIAKAWKDRGIVPPSRRHLVDQSSSSISTKKEEVSGHSHEVAYKDRAGARAHSEQQLASSKESREVMVKARDGVPIGDTTVDKAHTPPLPEIGPEIPDCPHRAIIELYTKNLPALRAPRDWGPQRQLALRSRWREAASGSYGKGFTSLDEGLAWWAKFFRYIAAKCPGLANGIPNRDGRVWMPDLEWIVKRANFVKIIEGAYEN